MHCESRRRKMPEGAPPIMSTHPALSTNCAPLVAPGCGTPSSTYSLASALKILSTRNCCSRSFVKLMHSCSKPFVSKSSKPKTSSIPMNGSSDVARPSVASAPPRPRLIARTIQMKTSSYSERASASRAPAHCAGVSAITSCSCMPATVRRRSSSSGAMSTIPSSACGASSERASAGAELSEPPAAGPKATLPSCSTAQMIRRTPDDWYAAMPAAPSTLTVASSSSAPPAATGAAPAGLLPADGRR